MSSKKMPIRSVLIALPSPAASTVMRMGCVAGASSAYADGTLVTVRAAKATATAAERMAERGEGFQNCIGLLRGDLAQGLRRMRGVSSGASRTGRVWRAAEFGLPLAANAP